jgi:hypothetical protein
LAPLFYFKTPLQWSIVNLFYQFVNRQKGFANRKNCCFHPNGTGVNQQEVRFYLVWLMFLALRWMVIDVERAFID